MTCTPEKDPDFERLDAIAADLGEHYDTVQIFVTRYNSESDKTTMRVSRGTGNWFARFGQIALWLAGQKHADMQGKISTDSDEDEDSFA
jgi:hypothetical protein